MTLYLPAVRGGGTHSPSATVRAGSPWPGYRARLVLNNSDNGKVVVKVGEKEEEHSAGGK